MPKSESREHTDVRTLRVRCSKGCSSGSFRLLVTMLAVGVASVSPDGALADCVLIVSVAAVPNALQVHVTLPSTIVSVTAVGHTGSVLSVCPMLPGDATAVASYSLPLGMDGLTKSPTDFCVPGVQGVSSTSRNSNVRSMTSFGVFESSTLGDASI